MLKVVVFDSGFGGELFADKIEEELPVEVIRVIDWRNAEKILKSAREARKVAKNSLKPYIGNVDLIVFANHLLSITSLKYFQRKYKNQKFVGFSLKEPDSFVKKKVLILTTKAVARTINFYQFKFKMHRDVCTLTLDEWPEKIDDGELTDVEIGRMTKTLEDAKFKTEEIILACAQFNDIKEDLKKVFGGNVRIYDSFDMTFRRIYKVLRLRGGMLKK